MKIRWTKDALRSLEEIYTYIASDRPAALKKVVIQIENNIQKLNDFPELGRTGRIKGTRELIVAGTSYIIIYRIKDRYIEILLILHSSLPYPKIYE